MRLSIIVPIYNVEQYIVECLDSIYKQNLSDFEVLCIDDKGKDKSIEKIEEYIKKNDIYNLRVIEHDKNKGLSEARNTGMATAKGNYICFLDSDDKLEKDGIVKLLEKAEQEDLDIAEGKVIELFETECNIELGANISNRKESEILNGDEYFYYSTKNELYVPMVWSRIYKTEYIKNKFSFVPGLKFEDEEFSPRVIINAKRVQYLDIPFYIYRRRDNSITTNMIHDNKWVYHYLKIIDNLSEFLLIIKNKKSYNSVKDRIGSFALSILKNSVAYGTDQSNLKEIINLIKIKKIYRIPQKCQNIKIKIQGYIMQYPEVFIKLYNIRNYKEKLWKK